MDAVDIRSRFPPTKSATEWRSAFSDAHMFRLLGVVTDLTSRIVALENLSLHLFADNLFAQSDPLAELDNLRERLINGTSEGSSYEGLVSLHAHYDRMLGLLEGVALRSTPAGTKRRRRSK